MILDTNALSALADGQQQFRRQAGEAPTQRWLVVCDGLPGNVASIFNTGAEQVVSMGGVELLLDPGEGSQIGEARDESQGGWRRVHSGGARLTLYRWRLGDSLIISVLPVSRRLGLSDVTRNTLGFASGTAGGVRPYASCCKTLRRISHGVRGFTL